MSSSLTSAWGPSGPGHEHLYLEPLEAGAACLTKDSPELAL